MENSSKDSIKPKNKDHRLKKWEVPMMTSLNVNKTGSNFNDTIVDNETGSSGS